MRVLLVEDDEILRESLCESLEQLGFTTLGLDSADNILRWAGEHRPDVVLLDQGLPVKTGCECLRELRSSEELGQIPVIMLTGQTDNDLVVNALDWGADDFLQKPIVPRELAARIRAVCRRFRSALDERRKQMPIDVYTSIGSVPEASASSYPESIFKGLPRAVFVDGEIKVDSTAYRVHVGEREVSLTLTEFRILQVLLGHRETVLTRDQLRAQGLGSNHATDRTVDVHIAAIRRKLGAAGDRIRTVRGVGYCFESTGAPAEQLFA